MSTALLKFQTPKQAAKEMPLDPGILAAALDASPQPLGVIENGKLIYANRSFAQLSTQFGEGKSQASSLDTLDSIWRTVAFDVGARTLSVATLPCEPPPPSEATHLEMVGRLVGGVAHDFNNLLTGILLYCDLLKSRLTSTNPLTFKIEEIRHAAEQGAGLIRQLMTVGRSEKDAPRWVSFNHAVQEILPLLQRLAGEHIVITMNLIAGEHRVGLSLAEAQQLILNLVLNARDAMPAGGTVCLETCLREFQSSSPENQTLEFTVSDSGIGMDAETAAHIFEPFYTTKAVGRGTGTGLATVKRIVEEAGGTVAVNTASGRGTRMTVRLPQIELPEIEPTRLRPTKLGPAKIEPTTLGPMKIEPAKVEAVAEVVRPTKGSPRRQPQQSDTQPSKTHPSQNRGVGV